jgi:hypothetical protein
MRLLIHPVAREGYGANARDCRVGCVTTGCPKGKKQHMPGVFVYHGCTGARGRVSETLTHEKGSYNLLCLFLFSTIYSHLSKHLMKKFTATFLLL